MTHSTMYHAHRRILMRQALAFFLHRQGGTVVSVDLPRSHFNDFFSPNAMEELSLWSLPPLSHLEPHGRLEPSLTRKNQWEQSYPHFPTPFFLGNRNVRREYLPSVMSPFWGQSHLPVSIEIRTPQTAFSCLRCLTHIHCNDASFLDWLPLSVDLLRHFRPSLDFTPGVLQTATAMGAMIEIFRSEKYKLFDGLNGQLVEDAKTLKESVNHKRDILAFPEEQALPEEFITFWKSDANNDVADCTYYLNPWTMAFSPAYEAEYNDADGSGWGWTGPHAKAQALLSLPCSGEWEINLRYKLHDRCDCAFPVAIDRVPILEIEKMDTYSLAKGSLNTKDDFYLLSVSSPTFHEDGDRCLRACLFDLKVSPAKE